MFVVVKCRSCGIVIWYDDLLSVGSGIVYHWQNWFLVN